MNIFRINTVQQLKILIFVILPPISLLLFIFYFELFNIFVFIPFGILLILDTLPSILLHINYYKANNGVTLTINKDENLLFYDSKDRFIESSLSKISCICLILSTVYYTGRHSFGQYRYCKIVLIDGTEIVINCLMINDIENTLVDLLDVKPLVERRLLCFIK